MNGDLTIRRAAERDAERICEIYNGYVVDTAVSFETAAVSAIEMRQRIAEKLATYNWIVAEQDSQVVGFAYYGSFRSRAAYRHTVESTVYISPERQGRGFGKELYSALLRSAAERNVREVVGVIALPNPASVALHGGLGFREIGILQGVGYKFGKYHDIALWQKSLRRAQFTDMEDQP